MNQPALICSGLTAATLMTLFYGSLLCLVFGFALFWQLLGALGDPDNKKATGADNTDGNK